MSKISKSVFRYGRKKLKSLYGTKSIQQQQNKYMNLYGKQWDNFLSKKKPKNLSQQQKQDIKWVSETYTSNLKKMENKRNANLEQAHNPILSKNEHLRTQKMRLKIAQRTAEKLITNQFNNNTQKLSRQRTHNESQIYKRTYENHRQKLSNLVKIYKNSIPSLSKIYKKQEQESKTIKELSKASNANGILKALKHTYSSNINVSMLRDLISSIQTNKPTPYLTVDIREALKKVTNRLDISVSGNNLYFDAQGSFLDLTNASAAGGGGRRTRQLKYRNKTTRKTQNPYKRTKNRTKAKQRTNAATNT